MNTRNLIANNHRQGIGPTIIAAIIIVVILIIAGGAYYAFYVNTSTTVTTTPTTVSTTTSSAAVSTTTSQSTSTSTTQPFSNSTALSLTFANVPTTNPAIGSDEAGSAALANLYDTLVFPTASGGIQPDLATTWSISSSGLTYTFNLRSGVTFHNGDPLTAQDVVFSMNRLLSMAQGYSYLFSPYVANISAPSPTQVVINLKSTFGPFTSALVRLYVLDESQVIAHEVSGTYANGTDYGSTWLLTHDAGSGPYYMVSLNPEANMVLGEYTNYWNGTNPSQPAYVQFYGTSTTNHRHSTIQQPPNTDYRPVAALHNHPVSSGAEGSSDGIDSYCRRDVPHAEYCEGSDG